MLFCSYTASYSSGPCDDVSYPCDLWNWAQEKYSGNMCLHMEINCGHLLKNVQKTVVFRVFNVFSAGKSYILYWNIDYHYISNYSEIMGPSLIFSGKRAMICEFFVANLSKSCVVVYWWSTFKVFDNFWSFGNCGISHNCGLWNRVP